MPVVVGRLPVSSATRDGLQAGAAQCALVNSMPWEDSLSIFGVRACGWPPSTPVQSFRSSMAMKSTLGFWATSLGEGVQETATNTNSVKSILLNISM